MGNATEHVGYEKRVCRLLLRHAGPAIPVLLAATAYSHGLLNGILVAVMVAAYSPRLFKLCPKSRGFTVEVVLPGAAKPHRDDPNDLLLLVCAVFAAVFSSLNFWTSSYLLGIVCISLLEALICARIFIRLRRLFRLHYLMRVRSSHVLRLFVDTVVSFGVVWATLILSVYFVYDTTVNYSQLPEQKVALTTAIVTMMIPFSFAGVLVFKYSLPRLIQVTRRSFSRMTAQ